ncbi:CpsB/CapC family capsule biosynthesis tyrosine phosphatase [Pseudothermotoga sp.]|nr:hypothetical protein [Pseudothermotoga sp.]MDW8140512.1 CpsB/CapC family capsule biosynthesis tyrosine phosphatase [Pseudothermotoga sp.]
MIDIHSHILPNLDDGFEKEEHLDMAERDYRSAGFQKVYLTPHLHHPKFPNVTIERILEKYQRVSTKHGEFFEIGCELYLGDYPLKSFLPLGRLPFVLVELPTTVSPTYLMDAIFQIELKGYSVVIAHVERYEYFFENSLARKLKDRGVFFQVNVFSIENKDDNAIYYFKKDMIDFIASDAHSLEDVSKLKNVNWKKYEKILTRSSDLLK